MDGGRGRLAATRLPYRPDAMNEVAAACASLPELTIAKGATLIEEGVRIVGLTADTRSEMLDLIRPPHPSCGERP